MYMNEQVFILNHCKLLKHYMYLAKKKYKKKEYVFVAFHCTDKHFTCSVCLNLDLTAEGEEEEEERVGNYDETSIRYKGKHIPSPSFRVLQTWAQHDPLESEYKSRPVLLPSLI